MIHIKCTCGETYHADEAHVGRAIQCPTCGTVNRIDSTSSVQSTSQSRAQPVSIPTGESGPGKHASQSIFGVSRRMKVAIVASVVCVIFGIAVALGRLWNDSSNKLASEVASTVTPSVVPPPTQPHDIQPSLFEPTPSPPNPWHQIGNLAPAQSSPDDLASPTTNGEARQIPLPPCAQGQQVERPQTGARIAPDQGTAGSSKLTISNGTRREAVIRLVRKESGRTARFVYIDAGKKYTLANIEPGSYLLRFTSGYDWVPACRDFLREPDYSEFEDSLSFESVIPTDGQEGYTTRYEVSLNEVPLGNARKRNIDRKRFFEGDQYVAVSP